MWKKLITTDNDWGALVLRLALAIAIFPHGAQKLLGWYGGNGFSGTMDFMTSQMGLPAVVVFQVIIGEFFCPLGLLVGFLGRVAAGGIAIIMAGAMTFHWSNGFFMNWYGNQQGEGFEYHILAIGIALALVIKGSGALSFDRHLAGRRS